MRVSAAALRSMILLALATSGCAQPSLRTSLLEQSYRAIQQSYLEPIAARTEAMGSLRQLTVADRAVTVEEDAREIVLKYRGQALAPFPAPAASDWRGWSIIVTAAAESATRASPAISHMASDALNAALIKGAVELLDEHSHYFPPDALPLGKRERQVGDPAAPRAVSAAAHARPDPAGALPVHDDIAVLRIDRFEGDTGRRLRSDLATAAARPHLHGVSLDLRDNPGGDVPAAVEVARLFLSDAMIMILERRDPAKRQVVFARGSDAAPRVPLIVLVNGGTASAAEIVAAALQGNGRALLVGSPSYGKGVVQSRFRLADGGELWVTSGTSITPAGYILHKHGVVPDVCVSLSPSASPASRARRYAALTTRPRRSLTEAEWAELRRLCPPVAPGKTGSDAILRRGLERLQRAGAEVSIMPPRARLD